MHEQEQDTNQRPIWPGNGSRRKPDGQWSPKPSVRTWSIYPWSFATAFAECLGQCNAACRPRPIFRPFEIMTNAVTRLFQGRRIHPSLEDTKTPSLKLKPRSLASRCNRLMAETFNAQSPMFQLHYHNACQNLSV